MRSPVRVGWSIQTGRSRARVAATEDALAAGYTGLRAVVDATALTGTVAQRVAYAHYEYLLDQQSSVLPLATICAYDVAQLGRAAVAEMACLHPLTSRGASAFRLYTDDGAAFTLAGEIDFSSAGQLADTLGRVLPLMSGSELVVDGRQLEFIDHRGLLVLDRCAGQRGIRLALYTPRGDGGADRGGDRPATPARGRAAMSHGAPTGRAGFRHEAALYASDEEFLALAVPFLADGIAAGDPTLLAVPAPLQRRVQEALGDPAGLTLLAA